MSIIQEVCQASGHRIQSLRASDALDPKTGYIQQRFEIRCVWCGKDLTQIENFKLAGKPRIRKPKGQVTNEHNRSSTESAEVGSQDPDGSAVRSAERPVFEP